MPESWKSLSGGSVTAGAVAAADKDKKSVTQLSEADKKVEEARKKIEQEYEEFRKGLSDVVYVLPLASAILV